MHHVARTALALLLFAVAPFAWAGPYEEAQEIVADPKALAERYDEAVDKFRQAATSNPANIRAWYNLGLLEWMRGRTDAARQAWQKAVEADPTFQPAQARLAQLQLTQGDRAGAIAKLEAIVADNRYQPEARNILAALAIEDEDWDAAIKHARNVLLGDPENANAYLNLAVAYFQQGLIDQAWLIVSNALDRRPDAAALHNMMGLIYLEKDNARHATESFLRALKEDPRHVDAKLNLGALELAYGDFESALSRFGEVLEARPDDPMVQISRGVALRGLQRFDEAEQGYEAALKARPGMPEALYNLCVLHHQYTSKWEEAKAACERYEASLDKDHPKRREIRMRLEAIDATLEALRAEAEEQRRLEEEQRQQEGSGAGESDDDAAPEPDEADEPDGGSAHDPENDQPDTTASRSER